jgi:hypothetical protein
MAYYSNLVAAWNGATQPPSGVTGAALTGLTTAQKLTTINEWTVMGSIPASFTVSGVSIWNCINGTELQALSVAVQQLLASMCSIAGGLLIGSAETQTATVNTLIANFNPGSSMTASIAGTTMTVTIAPAKPIVVGAVITNGAAAGTTVMAFGTGTGGTGTYTVSIPQTVASSAMTQTGPTIAALQALAEATSQDWWQAVTGGNLTSPVGPADLTAPGTLALNGGQPLE